MGCANQQKRPACGTRAQSRLRGLTVNHGLSQVPSLLDTSNILSTESCFNLPLCGKLACFKPNLVVLSALGKDWIGPCCFVKLRLIDETRAFVACIDTHDPLHWEIRVVQTGHTNRKHAFGVQRNYTWDPSGWRSDDHSFSTNIANRKHKEIIETQGRRFFACIGSVAST